MPTGCQLCERSTLVSCVALLLGVAFLIVAEARVDNSDGCASGAVPAVAKPLGKRVTLTKHSSSPATPKFRYGIFDGTYIWCSPGDATSVLRLDPRDSTNTLFNGFPAMINVNDPIKFFGGVFDGTHFWMTPFNAAGLVAVDVSDGSMVGYNAWPSGGTNMNIGNRAFGAATYVSGFAYYNCWYSTRILIADTSDGSMTALDSSIPTVDLGQLKFGGMIYDGSKIWLGPFNEDVVLTITPGSNAMATYNAWPPTVSATGPNKFTGGLFDGLYVWLVPEDPNAVVRVHTGTGAMTAYDNGGVFFGNRKFRGGCFDGEAMWMSPADWDDIVRVDLTDGSMISYTLPSGTNLVDYKFQGCVFDGNGIWFIPNTAGVFVHVEPITRTESPSLSASATLPRIDLLSSDGMSSGAAVVQQPLGDEVQLREHDISPLPVEVINFRSGVFDGTYIWMIPARQEALLRIDPATNTNTVYNGWPVVITATRTNKFYGGIFDGTNVWMIPFNAHAVVAILASTGTMSSFSSWPAPAASLSIGTTAFGGGTLAHGVVYMMPWDADRILTIDTTAGNVMGGIGSSHADVDLTTNNGPFRGTVFDGHRVWMIPTTNKNLHVVSLDPVSHVMATHGNWPAAIDVTLNRKFHGGTYDGSFLWFAPFSAAGVVRFDINTGAMEAFTGFPADVPAGANSFNGACHDGEVLWLVPRNAAGVVSVAADGWMKSYTDFPTGTVLGDQAFYGCVADGTSIWLANAKSPVLVRLVPATASRTMRKSASRTASSPLSRTPTKTTAPSGTASATDVPTRTHSATSSPTRTQIPSATASTTQMPTRTRSPTPSSSKPVSHTASGSLTVRLTPTATDQGLPSATLDPTHTRDVSDTRTLSPTPSTPRSTSVSISSSNSQVPTVSPPTTDTKTIPPTRSESTSSSRTCTASVPPTRTRPPTPSLSHVATTSPTVSNTIELTATVTAPATLTVPDTPTCTESNTVPMTPTATIAPPIPFNASVAFDGAIFAGALGTPIMARLTLAFDTSNHLGAAVARHNVSVVCANATVDAGSSWTTPSDTPVLVDPSGFGGASVVLRRPVAAAMPAAFRGVGDVCSIVVCAPYLRYCAAAPATLAVRYPELNVTTAFDNVTRSITVGVGIAGVVPAENVMLSVGVIGLVGVRLVNASTVAARSIQCTAENPGFLCTLGRMDPAEPSNATMTLEFLLAVPSFYVGDISVLASARPTNTDASFVSRFVYDLAASLMVAHEVGVVNASGLAVFLDVAEKALNVSSLPLPAGAGPVLTPAPMGFLRRAGSSLQGGNPAASPFGVHFVILTTLVFAVVLIIGQVVARVLRNELPPPLGEMPTWRIVAAHHLWVGVVLPCTVRCAAVHAMTLYVGILACYASAAGVLAATGGFGGSSRLALASVVGALSLSVPRSATWFLFHAYRVPNMVEVASGRSTLKQIRSRRAMKIKSMRRASKAFEKGASRDHPVSGRNSTGGVDLLSRDDVLLSPIDETYFKFNTTLQPLSQMDDEAYQAGDAADVAMELPDAVFPTFAQDASAMVGPGPSDWVRQGSTSPVEERARRQTFPDFEAMGFDDVEDFGEFNSPAFGSFSPKEPPHTGTSSGEMGPSATVGGLNSMMDSDSGAMPLIVVDDKAEKELEPSAQPDGEFASRTPNPAASVDSVALPAVYREASSRPGTVSSVATEWQIDHLFAVNPAIGMKNGATLSSPTGTIARLGQSFMGASGIRSTSPVPSASSNVSSNISASSAGLAGDPELVALGLTVPAMRDDEAPLELRVARFRRAGYAISAAFALVLAMVTISLSGRWGETEAAADDDGDDGSAFWVVIPIAFCLNATVVEALVLALCVLHRWVVEDLPADARQSSVMTACSQLLSLMRCRHPYDGELLDSAVESLVRVGE